MYSMLVNVTLSITNSMWNVQYVSINVTLNIPNSMWNVQYVIKCDTKHNKFYVKCTVC